MKREIKKNPDGKMIETVTHDDGSQSVKIHVKSLKVNETDEETLKAKEVIEKSVLPQLGVREVNVTVLHKPSNQFVSSIISLPYFQSFIKASLAGFPGGYTSTDEFSIIMHDGNKVTVSSVQLDDVL